MGEFNESKRSLSGMEKLSLETNRIPRDLLQRFTARNPSQLAATGMTKEEEGKDSEEIELNLGLSLGGRFGVDKSCEKKKLMRSSSIAGSIPVVKDYDAVARPPPVSYPTLIIRTSSLPVETEEEWRKRKELRTLRRMEAKRRRTEKQRISQAYAAAQNAILAGRRGNHMGGGGGGGGGCGSSCNQGLLQPVGSMESQGGSSSGMSESESRPFQGSSSYGEASPDRIQSLEDQANREAVGCSSGAKGRENTSKSSIAAVELPFKIPKLEEKQARERVWLNSMEDMPCVSTRGDGPNGRRIEGILYRYGKGEEVRIMCICHGSFLSPAEFVKHAGGGDVAHPLKHIVVNSSSISFM